MTVAFSLFTAIANAFALADFESYQPTSADHSKEWRTNDRLVGLWALAFIATGIAFLIWLWRARRNAETLCAARHRRSMGWILGGWFCPVVNLWFPAIILADVVRASDPRTPADAPTLRGRPGAGLVTAWWAALLVHWALAWLGLALSIPKFEVHTSGDDVVLTRAPLGGWYLIVTEFVATGVLAVAAILLALIIVRVGRWQRNRSGAVADPVSLSTPISLGKPVLPPAAGAGKPRTGGVAVMVVIAVLVTTGIVLGVIAAYGFRRDSGDEASLSAPTSTSTSTSSVIAATTTPVPLESRQRIADLFPGLVPAPGLGPDGRGYLNATCTYSTYNGIDRVACSPQDGGFDRLTYGVNCDANGALYREPPYSQELDDRFFRTEPWQRASESGYFRVTLQSVSAMEHLIAHFDEMPRATCKLWFRWYQHKGEDVIAQVWPGVPL
ncbi:DUF4328 domain-containing protein [Nocardia sp. NPDC127526]|uniref:DUF4328 domain-containing protein n=1 Tax=Nocardia sp. NPDC127526 TaxID=3345393 RepID=UPI00362E317A